MHCCSSGLRKKIEEDSRARGRADADTMRPGKYVLLACAVLGLLSTSGAVELTRENYDALTAGKSVLLKLYAPW